MCVCVCVGGCVCVVINVTTIFNIISLIIIFSFGRRYKENKKTSFLVRSDRQREISRQKQEKIEDSRQA